MFGGFFVFTFSPFVRTIVVAAVRAAGSDKGRGGEEVKLSYQLLRSEINLHIQNHPI